ncbi:13101_t:CDS:2, partial [Gigaspora rosea]
NRIDYLRTSLEYVQKKYNRCSLHKNERCRCSFQDLDQYCDKCTVECRCFRRPARYANLWDFGSVHEHCECDQYSEQHTCAPIQEGFENVGPFEWKKQHQCILEQVKNEESMQEIIKTCSKEDSESTRTIKGSKTFAELSDMVRFQPVTFSIVGQLGVDKSSLIYELFHNYSSPMLQMLDRYGKSLVQKGSRIVHSWYSYDEFKKLNEKKRDIGAKYEAFKRRMQYILRIKKKKRDGKACEHECSPECCDRY